MHAYGYWLINSPRVFRILSFSQPSAVLFLLLVDSVRGRRGATTTSSGSTRTPTATSAPSLVSIFGRHKHKGRADFALCAHTHRLRHRAPHQPRVQPKERRWVGTRSIGHSNCLPRTCPFHLINESEYLLSPKTGRRVLGQLHETLREIVLEAYSSLPKGERIGGCIAFIDRSIQPTTPTYIHP